MSNPNVTIDRHKYVGGSDLPSILGLNIKYNKKPYDLALEKAGIIPNSFKGNQFTKYGQVMEPIIRDYINSKYQVNYLEDTVIDTERGYRGNTDGIDRNVDTPILEIKTFGDELDIDYYMAQCQFYMETFNQDACLLVGYKRPNDFYTGVDYELEKDDSYFNYDFDPNNIEETIIYRDKSLWEKIEERIIAFKKAVEYLKENKDNYNEKKFNNIFYGNEIMTLSNKIETLENKIINFKEVEKDYKESKEKLYKLFEEKGIISLDFDNIKITKVNPTSYDTTSIDSKKLKEEQPRIYEKYKIIKTTNRKGYILITIKEEKNNAITSE